MNGGGPRQEVVIVLPGCPLRTAAPRRAEPRQLDSIELYRRMTGRGSRRAADAIRRPRSTAVAEERQFSTHTQDIYSH